MNPKDKVGSRKAPLGLVPSALEIGASEAMANGAERYGPFNWREQPVEYMTYLVAIKRHIDALIDGEDNAPDTGIHHLKHIAAGAGILLDALNIPGDLIDNRPPKGPAARMLAELDKSEPINEADKHDPAKCNCGIPNCKGTCYVHRGGRGLDKSEPSKIAAVVAACDAVASAPPPIINIMAPHSYTTSPWGSLIDCNVRCAHLHKGKTPQVNRDRTVKPERIQDAVRWYSLFPDSSLPERYLVLLDKSEKPSTQYVEARISTSTPSAEAQYAANREAMDERMRLCDRGMSERGGQHLITCPLYR